jgi:hypothetical protein
VCLVGLSGWSGERCDYRIRILADGAYKHISVFLGEASKHSMHKTKIRDKHQADIWSQHRVQDFEFIAKGILGIMEQQMTSMNNLLPGARKSVAYMHETGEAPVICHFKTLDQSYGSYFLLEND